MDTVNHSLQKPRGRGFMAFWLALVLGILLFLPFIIYDHGYFFYYGDFNVQQIPFYQMAHDCVRSGNIFWNWNTDLGANFIGSYSFYVLGSPFFWLTLPFPSAAVPYLMAPLLILKFACASAAAYAFLRRFVRPNLALLGGLLYAFSGFSLYNIFFNHFHEAIVYFPLMLLGLEWYMKDDRRGLFALTVFLSALNNYYFFIGQVFFILIYWFVRLGSGEWKLTFTKFLWLFFEAVIGTAGAAVFLLPSFYAVIQNPRTDNLLAGWNFLLYNKPQRLLDVLHSFFFPQDIPARENFFPESDNKWASMSAWLPLFGCSGVIAYFQSRKHKDWLRRMLIICFFCAVIPGLNAMFQLFNSMYYARWYYMMVLILVLATVMCFEQADQIKVNWNRAFGWTFGCTAFFALTIGLLPQSWTPDEETGRIKLGLMKLPGRFWLFVGIAVICLVLAYLLVLLFRHERRLFPQWSIAVTCCVILMVGWYLVGLGKANNNFMPKFVRENALNASIQLPDDGRFYRVDFNEGMDNLGMFWRMPTIQTFHSVVPGSVMEFYPTIGVDRSVASRPDNSHYALRGLTSVRWLFDYENTEGLQGGKDPVENADKFFVNNKTGQPKMPGWEYYDTQNGFKIYENQYYVPMGFTYDAILSRTEYDDKTAMSRELALMKALVVEDADLAVFEALLPHLDEENTYYNRDQYLEDCLARRESAASSFSYDNRGFTAVIGLEKDSPVFFSVPYESGWTATVNGEPAQIYTVNVGFMAVICPAGEQVTIRFDYMTPGLYSGGLISLASLLLLLIYVLCMRAWYKKRRPASVPLLAAYPEEDIPGLPADIEAFPGENPVPPEGSLPNAGPAPAAVPEPDADPDGFDLYKLYPDAPRPPDQDQ